MKKVYMEISSPLGSLRLVAGEGGALAAVHLPSDGNGDAAPGEERPDHPVLREAARQLREYFAGSRRSFELPLERHGTPFQEAVWKSLERIPFGETRTYGDVATELGRPGAARAVGAANARNPIAIVVPCHRVIGSGGALIGYGGGIDVKRWLLEHESPERRRR